MKSDITLIKLNIYSVDCVLFFGCRNKEKDFFCEEEWLPLVQNGTLNLYTAFSRDQVNISCVNSCLLFRC